jgi:glycosyl-4,4'-diaponeurosporenoate acyltransferase
MIPLVHLGRPLLVLVDVVAWGLVHSITGYAVHRTGDASFASDTWLTRERAWEQHGRRYLRFGIRRWKDRLPEAGALFAGGTSKRTVPAVAAGGLQRLAIETRRAEWGHWSAMAPGPLFALWNPLPIAAVMVVYGVAVNAPFIAIQRYNRLRVTRTLERAGRTSSGRGDAAARSRNDFGITGNNIP